MCMGGSFLTVFFFYLFLLIFFLTPSDWSAMPSEPEGFTIEATQSPTILQSHKTTLHLCFKPYYHFLVTFPMTCAADLLAWSPL